MRIAYLGIFQFPEGDAGAARVLGIGRALRECGHEVVFFGIEKSQHSQESSKYPDVGHVSIYQDFKYRSPTHTGTDIWDILKRQISILIGSSFLCRLAAEDTADGPSFDTVVAYQVPLTLLIRLKHWCKTRRIPLICDVVEWYDPKQLFLGRMGPYYWDSEMRMRLIRNKADGVIAISKYLADYCRTSGKKVIRIPPIVDVSNVCTESRQICVRKNNKGLLMVYAGIPGRKDLLGNVLRGIVRLREKGNNVSIKIVGMSREKVLACLNANKKSLDSLGNGLIVHQRVPRSDVQSLLAEADFMPLLRPDERYANAGFPTKIVESFAAGVPVIANLTSDLGEYLHEGKNAFIVRAPTVEDFVETVERALINRDKWETMRHAAKKCAEDYFDYRVYKDSLNNFMTAVSQTVTGGDIGKKTLDHSGF